MPYNGSGSFSLAESAFVPNTPISSSAMNSDLSDIATNGLTNAVTKDGQTTITGAFKGANGSVGLPMYSFASDTDTGMYRHGANELGFSTGGTLGGWFDSSQKFFMLGAADVTGVLSLLSTSHVNIPNGTTGQRPGSPAAAMLRWNSSLSVPEIYNGSTWINLFSPAFGRGYIDGFIIANGTDATNDINFAAGVCRDSTNTVNITGAALVKQLDANWAAGTNAGMRNSAAGIANGTYHLYAVSKADFTQDFYAYAGVAGTDPDSAATVAAVITALQAETGGSAYLYARRVASILRESNTIIPFFQYGNNFSRKAVVQDVSAANPGTSAVTRTLSVPLGLTVTANVYLNVGNAAGGGFSYGLLSDLTFTDVAASSTISNLPAAATASGGSVNATSQVFVRTNSSGQIRSRLSFSDANTGITINSLGWTDARGQNNTVP